MSVHRLQALYGSHANPPPLQHMQAFSGSTVMLRIDMHSVQAMFAAETADVAPPAHQD